jgi:hypothetical protein
MGEDSKVLMGKLQEQMKENAKEAIGNLPKHSTKSGDLKEKGQDFSKIFLRQQKKHERRKADQPLITPIMLSAPHSLHIRICPGPFATSLWGGIASNTPISHTCENQSLHILCLRALQLQRCLTKYVYHDQRHRPCLTPATIHPHTMFMSLA